MATPFGGLPTNIKTPNSPDSQGYTPAQIAKNFATPGDQVEKSPYYMDQKQGYDLQFGPNGGYYVPKMNTSSNPWSSMGAQDQMAQTQGTQQANQNVNNLQGQMANYAGNANAYPTMSNSYGIGEQPSAVPGQAAGPSFQTQPLNVTMPDSGSRGFNPWSLSGESNARGN